MGIKQSNGTAATAMILAQRVVTELEVHSARLDNLIESSENARRRKQTQRWVSPEETVDAGGEATFRFTVPSGMGWSLVSLAGTGSNVTTAYGALYLGEVGAQTIIRAFSAGLVFSDDFTDKEYVPSHTVIVARLYGMTPGDVATLNLRYEVEDD